MPKRGSKCKVGYFRAFNYILKVLYTGMQWKELPIQEKKGKPEIHYTGIYKLYARWSKDGSIKKAFSNSVKFLSNKNKLDTSILHGDGSNTVAKSGGDGIGYSGHKHLNGEKVMAIVDNNGYIISPYTITSANRSDCILLPDSLKHLTKIKTQLRLNLKGTYLNLDGGFDSISNRKDIFNRGMIPNIAENKRGRKRVKLGRKRLFNKHIHSFRYKVERTFSWEDKFKRLLIRMEYIQERHFGFKLLAYTLINLRQFCQA